MNKRYILPIAFAIVLASAVFVLASQVESGTTIYKGWNLVYGFTPSSLNGQGFDFSHIKAIYTYIPQEKKYVRIFPNPENSIIDKYGDSYFEKQVNWVYSDSETGESFNGVFNAVEYWVEEPLPLAQRQSLYQGWNFVGITSDITDNSLNDIKGDCTITDAYLWDAQSQQWGTVLNLLNSKLANILDDAELMSTGVAVKVSSDCKLGISGGTITPPPSLP